MAESACIPISDDLWGIGDRSNFVKVIEEGNFGGYIGGDITGDEDWEPAADEWVGGIYEGDWTDLDGVGICLGVIEMLGLFRNRFERFRICCIATSERLQINL